MAYLLLVHAGRKASVQGRQCNRRIVEPRNNDNQQLEKRGVWRTRYLRRGLATDAIGQTRSLIPSAGPPTDQLLVMHGMITLVSTAQKGEFLLSRELSLISLQSSLRVVK
jgi:hypothetical protein